MNFLRSQSQASPEQDEKSNTVPRSTLSGKPGAFESLQTLHEQTDFPITAEDKGDDDDLELNKGVELTGKYAKYAGKTPDGGLKAWTVVFGYLGYRFFASSLWSIDDDDGCRAALTTCAA